MFLRFQFLSILSILISSIRSIIIEQTPSYLLSSLSIETLYATNDNLLSPLNISAQNTVNSVTAICGKEIGILQPFLDPPRQVQELLDITFGESVGIGKVPADKCSNLAKVLGDDDFIYVALDPSSSSSGGALSGPDAAKQKSTRASNGGSAAFAPKKTFSGASSAISTISPLCVAIRPCGKTSETYLTQLSFGVYSEPGITLIPASAATAGFELKVNGLAFSMVLNPSLYNDVVPKGMHMWIQCTIHFPINRLNKKKGHGQEIATVAIVAQLGMYGDINGEPDIASFLNGGSVEKVQSALESGNSFNSAHFQFFATAKATIAIDLSVLLGITGMSKFKIEQFSSFMYELKFTKNDPSNSYLALYISKESKIDFSQLFPKAGAIGSLLSSAAFDLSILQKIYLKVQADQQIFFGLSFGMLVKWDCASVTKAIETVTHAGDAFFRLAPSEISDEFKSNLKKTNELIGKICLPQEQNFRIQFEYNGYFVNDQNTFVSLCDTYLRLSDLPSCPAPVKIGGRCSENRDCKGEDFGGYSSPDDSGYCLNSPSLKSSIGCSGKCIDKLPALGDCSKETMNLPPWNNALFLSAEHVACQSHQCTCGKCANPETKKMPSGSDCSANSDCESNYCESKSAVPVFTVACMGTCVTRKKDGEECRFDGSCESNSCYCKRCKSASERFAPTEAPCSYDKDCASTGDYCPGGSEITCGTCQNKLTNGQSCGLNSGICQSNYCSAKCGGVCISQTGVGNGGTCESNSNCNSDYCPGGLTCGSCDSKLSDGSSCKLDSSCAAGFCNSGFVCGRNRFGDGTLCVRDGDCSSNACRFYISAKYCSPMLGPGTTCSRSQDCSSNDCGNKVCDREVCVPFVGCSCVSSHYTCK